MTAVNDGLVLAAVLMSDRDIALKIANEKHCKQRNETLNALPVWGSMSMDIRTLVDEIQSLRKLREASSDTANINAKIQQTKKRLYYIIAYEESNHNLDRAEALADAHMIVDQKSI